MLEQRVKRSTICHRLFYLETLFEKLSTEDANKEIAKNLKWIWAALKLEDVGNLSVTNKTAFPSSVYIRQINTFLCSLRKAVKGDAIEAYHELACFIDNYQQNWREPFDEWERFALRAMIECILPLVEPTTTSNIEHEETTEG